MRNLIDITAYLTRRKNTTNRTSRSHPSESESLCLCTSDSQASGPLWVNFRKLIDNREQIINAAWTIDQRQLPLSHNKELIYMKLALMWSRGNVELLSTLAQINTCVRLPKKHANCRTTHRICMEYNSWTGGLMVTWLEIFNFSWTYISEGRQSK